MKPFFLMLITVLFTLSAWAAPKHLVFNLDGTLIQGIPKRNFDRFSNKDQMISATLSGQTKYFYIIPYTPRMLTALAQKNDVVIHVASKHSRQDTVEILKKISLPEPINDSFYSYFEGSSDRKILTQEDLVTGKIDLSKISSDLKNTVLLTTYVDIVKPEFKDQEVIVGKPYYFFESYSQAETELKADPRLAASIPGSREEWDQDQSKIAFTWQMLLSANFTTTNDLVKSFKALKPDVKSWTKRGLDWAQFGFVETVPKWKLNSSKTAVVSCGEYSFLKKSFTINLTWQDCLDYYGTKFTYQTNDSTKTVIGCEERDESSNAIIRPATIAECMDHSSEAVQSYWEGSARTKCVSYLSEKYLVRSEDNSKCGDEHVITEGKKIRFTSLFFDGKSYVEAIPGIMKLSRGSVIPGESYKFDSKIIAQTLIRYIQQTREAGNDASKYPSYNFQRDTRIVMAINYHNFDKIKVGGFLNQHQTGTTNGCNCPDKRAAVEDSFLGLRLESSYRAQGSRVHEVRPKYTYLILDAPHSGMGETTISGNYGNVYLKFKEEIKNRSTFTAGDSLAGLVPMTFTFRQRGPLATPSSNYWESQIWGELKLKDVEYVMVNCPSMASISQAQIDNIKREGLSVYQCLTTTSGYTTIGVSKGKEL